MNHGQKEYYKRDYAVAKAAGKPFFPYAVYKDLLIASLAIGLVIALAIWQRVGVGEPVNPATTDYVPRPEWYFLFLFDLLRIFKGQNALMPVIMATFIIPNILMALLILTPVHRPGAGAAHPTPADRAAHRGGGDLLPGLPDRPGREGPRGHRRRREPPAQGPGLRRGGPGGVGALPRQRLHQLPYDRRGRRSPGPGRT